MRKSNYPVPADVTGGLPTAMYLRSQPADESLGWRAQTFGWCGCLDAPELLPAGSTIPVNIPVAEGGNGYEGNVSRIAVRAGGLS